MGITKCPFTFATGISLVTISERNFRVHLRFLRRTYFFPTPGIQLELCLPPLESWQRDQSLTPNYLTSWLSLALTCFTVSEARYDVRIQTPVGFQVLTTMSVKNTAFWDMTSYCPVDIRRLFGRMYCLHLHGLKLSQASRTSPASYFHGLPFHSEYRGSILRNVGKYLTTRHHISADSTFNIDCSSSCYSQNRFVATGLHLQLWLPSTMWRALSVKRNLGYDIYLLLCLSYFLQ